MRSTVGRALLGAALLIVAILLFTLLSDDGGDDGGGGAGDAPTRMQESAGDGAGRAAKRPKPSIVRIEIENGEPVGGIRELEFESGERIAFVVDSDVADEVHVHGYDLSEEVGAGGAARFDFAATLEGVFEVELEERGVPIAELRVTP